MQDKKKKLDLWVAYGAAMLICDIVKHGAGDHTTLYVHSNRVCLACPDIEREDAEKMIIEATLESIPVFYVETMISKDAYIDKPRIKYERNRRAVVSFRRR
ncbi:MAG: hypothetical protein OXB93_03000 [Cytophagales bacterium]|nr:hypothetical protein [Cytophagales bacterium]